MTNKEMDGLQKGDFVDVYVNALSVTANPAECLIRLSRETPSETDPDSVETEHLANVRMSLFIAKQLANILNNVLDEVDNQQEIIVEK